MNELRVYIHIPFCKSKCQYCDFNSYANKEYLMDSYVEAVCKEIDLYHYKIKNKKITSIYFGGGTPSYLKASLVKQILDKFNFDDTCEISIEINPETVNANKLNAYKNMGINRLSFGVQSLNNKLLRLMGRIHDKDIAINAIKLAKSIGFNNISVDLMFGYPLQPYEMYKNTLEEIVKLDIQHLSCYSLKIEKNTPLYYMIDKKMLPEIDEELDRKMYHLTNSFLRKNDIFQYEISNYAKMGYKCKHNVGYWKLDDYLGFGISAHSYFENKRFNNSEDIVEYIRGIKNNKLQVIYEESISKEESKKEYIILGLRLNSGINMSDYNKRYDTDFILEHGTTLETCIENGLLDVKGDIVKLTKKGRDLSNSVFVKFI